MATTVILCRSCGRRMRLAADGLCHCCYTRRSRGKPLKRTIDNILPSIRSPEDQAEISRRVEIYRERVALALPLFDDPIW